MIFDQIRNAHRAAPFRPFVLRMADGRTFPVPHPDFLLLAPDRRTVVVAEIDGSVHILDASLMTEIDIAPSQAAPA
jgi:hypothetical protein